MVKSRKKELEDEYFNIIKKGKVMSGKDSRRIKVIVKEWKEIMLND